MQATHTVAVLGAGGTMGFPMARNLARAGLAVRAWNRSREKAEPLAADGVVVSGSPAEAVQGADVVITMLADAAAVSAVMADARPGLALGVLWLQMSTIGEAGTQRCAGLASRSGLLFVDAPVLGTRAPAERGELVVLESGPEEARPRTQPVFDAIASRVVQAGPAGAGTRLKLVVNSWVLAVVEAGAETVALAEGIGVDTGLFFQAIDGGGLDLPYLRTKAAAMATRDFSPSFRLALAAKDASLVGEAVVQHGLDLPLFETIAERLSEGAVDHGDEDFSATYLTSSPDQAALYHNDKGATSGPATPPATRRRADGSPESVQRTGCTRWSDAAAGVAGR